MNMKWGALGKETHRLGNWELDDFKHFDLLQTHPEDKGLKHGVRKV